MLKLKFEQNIDKSGKMFRLSYLEKHYSDILSEVIKFSENNELKDLPFNQQVYHWFNNITTKVKCYCGNNVKFKKIIMELFFYYQLISRNVSWPEHTILQN